MDTMIFPLSVRARSGPRRPRRRVATIALGLLFCTTAAFAQVIPGAWTLRGPAPAHGGQVEGITSRPVTGAVEALAAHPTDPNILYAAAVNGGIWRTGNATAASPTWTKQTQSLASTSMGAIAFDPTDATNQTLVAGTRRVSSYASVGGGLLGMLRTINGGATWGVLDPTGPLSTRGIAAVVARGSILLAATDSGIYRSTNTGGSFTLVSGAVGTGLPAGATSDLVGRPGVNATLYTVVRSGAAQGVYRSLDTGATWTKVSDATVDSVFTGGTTRVRLAVGASGQVFVGIVRSSRLFEVFRSANGSTGWTALGVPLTSEQNGVQFGIHPGGQGGVHFSIAADPTNTNIVYVGGDRQPFFGEGVPGSTNFWPNSIGAQDFTGRLFRGNASNPPASRWTALTHNGTAGNSSPHADSRHMVFDANGDLLESDDGGVFRRSSPRLTTGNWFSVNGNLAITEYHGIAWDAVSNRVIGGTQDNGVSEQRDATTIFDLVSGGDGGDVAVEDWSSATTSVRYSSAQQLGNFRRRVVNASNVVTSTTLPALTPTSGSPAMAAAFYTPIATNPAGATRLLFGAANGVYESTNSGGTVTRISTLAINIFDGDPVVYGIPGNVGFLLFGSGSGVHRRTLDGGTITQIATLPARVVGVAVDQGASARLFAMTGQSVFYSNTATPNFVNVGGNLPDYNPGTLRSMTYVPTGSRAVVVGADRGVFVSYLSQFGYWYRLGTGLPNAPVYELEYDTVDNLLLAGTLGRGAWTFGALPAAPTPPSNVFTNGFEFTFIIIP